MKMQLNHYDYIKDAMAGFTPAMLNDYREQLKAQGKAKDIEKRLRWDMLYNSVSSVWICDNLYPYLDDTHIDTALKAIVKTIN